MHTQKVIRFSYRAAVLFLVALHCKIGSAGIISFVDRAAFYNAAGTVHLIDFETATPGSIANNDEIDGVTFTYDFGGVDLTVENSFVTTSGDNYLGTSDGGLLQDGDDISFSFAPVGGFGLYIISLDPLWDGDFTLTAGTATASLSASSVQQTLSDGSSVWFLGLRSNNTDSFSSAVLSTHGGGGMFLYNLDDFVTTNAMAVPEPSSLFLLASVALTFTCCRFRKPLKQRID